MAPKLKASCFLFWIIWIIWLAYMMAIYVYEDMFFLPVNEDLNIVSMIVTLVCLLTAALASCGCALIFFDATNFACILLYAIPLALTVPSLTAFASIKIAKANELTNASIKNLVIRDWKPHRQPRYLAETEAHRACCGLYGPFDYREFIYGKSCPNTAFDVPLSCCNITSLFRQPPLDIVNYTCGSRLAAKNVIDLYKCKGLFENIFSINVTLVNQMHNINLNEAELLKKKNLCKYASSTTAKIRDNYSEFIYSEGCLQFMISSNDLIVNGNYIFLICSSMVTFILLLVFLKNWYGTAELVELRPTSSNTHLSQETLILEGVKSRQAPLTKAAKEMLQ